MTKNKDDLTEAMVKVQDELLRMINKLAREFDISVPDANHVYYRRTRSRWTQEKEDYLIRLARVGEELPSIYEDFEVKSENN